MVVYILAKLERKPKRIKTGVQIFAGDKIALHVGSKYVLGVLLGTFAPRENAVIARLAMNFLKV